jgi:hypothetical protein
MFLKKPWFLSNSKMARSEAEMHRRSSLIPVRSSCDHSAVYQGNPAFLALPTPKNKDPTTRWLGQPLINLETESRNNMKELIYHSDPSLDNNIRDVKRV